MRQDNTTSPAVFAEIDRIDGEVDRILREQAPHLSAVSTLASRVRDDAVRLYERGVRSFNDNSVPIVTQSKSNAVADLEREYPFLKMDRMAGGAGASEMTSEYERMLTDYMRAIEAVNGDEDERAISSKYTTDADRARFRAVLDEVSNVHAFEPVRPSKQRSTLGNVGEQLSRGTADLADNLILLANKIAPAATPQDVAQKAERISGELLSSDVRATAEKVDPAISRDAGIVERGVMGAVRSLPYMAGGTAAFMSGGGLPGAIAFSFSQMAPDAYREYRGEGFNDAQATVLGGITGAFESAIEQIIGFDKIFLPKGVKDAAVKTVRQRLAELAKDRGIAWVGENIEEVAQDVSREAVGSIGAASFGNPDVQFDAEKFTFGRLAETAIATATMLAPGAALQAGRLTIKQPTADEMLTPGAVEAWIQRNPDVDVPATLSRDKFTELTGVQRSSGEQRAAWAQKINAAKPVVVPEPEITKPEATPGGAVATPLTEIPNEGQAEAEAGRQGNQEGLLRPTVATPGSGDVQTAADLGIAPQPAPRAVQPPEESLPPDLAFAKPRYGIGQWSFLPEFQSDLDKAAYILAQSKRSKRDADYLRFVRDRLGISEQEARDLGGIVRSELKALAYKAKSENAEAFSVPPIIRQLFPQATPEATGTIPESAPEPQTPIAEQSAEVLGTIPEIPDNSIPPAEPPQAPPASGEPFDYFGRPELANPMETKEGRKAGDVVDEAMKQAGEPERLSNKTVKQEAKARVEADYDALKDRIYTKGLIRDVYDMEVARIILNREYATATTEEAVEAWQKAYRHWRESGTEAARSLQIRQDRILSPLERQQQQIMDMLEGLNPDNEKPQTKVTRESVKRSLELRQRVTEELAKDNIDLNAVLSPDFIRPEPAGDSKEDREAADVEAKLRTRLRKAYISWVNSFKRLEGTGFSTIGPLGSKEIFDSTRKVAAAAIALGVFKFSKFVRSVARSLGKDATKAAGKVLADAWNAEVKASKNPKVDRTVAKESDVAAELDKVRPASKAQPKPVNELDHRTFAKIIRAIAIQRGGSVMDAAYAVTINNMLSAVRTFVVNLGGTATFSTYRAFGERLFQAMGADFLRSMGLSATGPRVAEFNHIFRVFIPALRQALQNASLAFETEISPTDPNVTSVESYTRMIGAFGRNPIAQKFGTAVRIPTRINLAADEFNKTMSAVLDVTARAYRTAVDEGKTGNAIDTRMAEILADRMSPEWEAAIKYARVGAFQDIDNPLAKAGLAAKRWWGVRWQLFFVLTPANIFTQGLRRSPAAFPYFFIKAMRASKFYKKFAKNDQDVDPLNADDYGSLVTAAIVTGLIYWIIGTDDDEYPWLTGTPSATKSVKAWERNNVPAYSIKGMDGKYYSYGWLEPFATTMAFTVDSVRAFKKDGAIASLGAGVASLWQQSQDKTFLQNIANLTRALETVRMAEDKGLGVQDAFKQYVQDYSTSFTPALWRAIVRSSREDFPERTDDYWKGMGAKLGSTDYFPRRDIWGKPVKQPEGPEENPAKFVFRMASPVTIIDPQKAFIGDRVLQRYLRASEGVPRFIDEISRTWTDKLAPTEKEAKKKLTDEQYDRYAELAGTVAKRLVEKVDFDRIGPIKGGEKVIDLLSLSREKVRTLLVPQWARGEAGNVDVDYVVDTLWQMHTLSEANKDKPKKPTVNMLSTDDTINRSAQENEAARQKRMQNN